MESSPLNNLPGELRNTIYALALTSAKLVEPNSKQPLEPTLTRTCNQMRQECQLIFWAGNQFLVDILDSNASTKFRLLSRWFAVVGSERLRCIKKLHVTVLYWGRDLSEKQVKALPEVLAAAGLFNNRVQWHLLSMWRRERISALRDSAVREVARMNIEVSEGNEELRLLRELGMHEQGSIAGQML